jgi:hypothetical protein
MASASVVDVTEEISSLSFVSSCLAGSLTASAREAIREDTSVSRS